MINILLADDHSIIRAGLKIFIETNITHAIIDEASDGDAAFEMIKARHYQLIILDVNMPGSDSFALVSNILRYKADANILMFSMNAEEVYAKKFLSLGVKGYISKAAPNDEILLAIQNVSGSKRYISSSLISTLTDDALGGRSNNPFECLSQREFEIVLRLIRGETSAQICKSLTLQSSTVGTHKARIFEKLNCDNIIDINTLAKVHNVIP